MDFSHPVGIAKGLIHLKLAEKDQLKALLREPGHRDFNGAEFLELLQNRQVLTPYQTDAIKRLDFEMLVLGDVKILYANASGSFARVYRGARVEDNKPIGLKVLRSRFAEDPNSIRMFQQEAKLGQGLKHKNIVPIYEIGQKEDIHFFTMEFVEGGNLRDFLKIRGKLTVEESLRFAIDIASGLEYALTQGATHRDLKPTNVLMSAQGVAKLIDFGLSSDEQMLSAANDQFQHALEYSTIEKHTDAPKNDPRSDLFFLGVILYEMLSGTPPYSATNSREERKSFVRYKNIRPIKQVAPHLTRAVCDIVEGLMHISPGDRYQSATEALVDMRREFQKISAENATPASNSSEAKPAAKPSVLALENRQQEQDILRDYFTRHNFQFMLLSNVERLSQRLQNNPPDAVLLNSDNLGEDPVGMLKLLKSDLKNQSVPCVALIKKRHKPLQEAVYETELFQYASQPASLRTVREQLTSMLQELGKMAKAETETQAEEQPAEQDVLSDPAENASTQETIAEDQTSPMMAADHRLIPPSMTSSTEEATSDEIPALNDDSSH